MSAPGQDAAQPTGTAPDGQGQGQDRTAYNGVLGPDAFSSAPEELRPHLEEYVRTQVDPHINQRFQDAAQFRQTWEPFSQIEGLSDLHPEAVDQLVEFGYIMEAAGDEQHPQHQQAVEALAETWEQMGEQFGFFDKEEGDETENADEPQYMTREEFEAELAQRDQQATMAQTEQQIQQEIHEAIGRLDLPGDPDSEEQNDAINAVLSFMNRYADDANMSNEDVVKAAFEDYQRLVGGGQRRLLKETAEVNGGQTIRGGGADTEPEKITSWRDADKAALARMRG
jgi:hypothetical protein